MWAVGDSIRQGEIHGEVTAVIGNTYYYWLENGTCGGCLAHRLQEGYRMGRPRKTDTQRKAEAEAKQTNTLLDAVRFCAGGFTANGEAYAQHALFYSNWVTTYNGVVMYGAQVDTPLMAAPHYGLLLKALQAADSAGLQITQLDQERLAIKGKGFRTVVPCVADLSQISRTPPDASIGPLDSRMRKAFEAMKALTSKNGEYVFQAAILMGNGFCAATDGQLGAMYWHGLGFPELVVPANFIEAVLKTPKALLSFGYTPDQSLTFYFDDGSFIRTQLYSEPYRDIAKVMPTEWDNMLQLPDTFFDALEKVKPFVDALEHSYVFFESDRMQTHESAEVGTVVDCAGLFAAESGLDVDRLLKLKGRITHIDYRPRERTKFYGENFRGVLCNFVFQHREPPEAAEPASHGYTDQGDGWAPPQPAGEVEPTPEDEAAVEAPAAGGWVAGE